MKWMMLTLAQAGSGGAGAPTPDNEAALVWAVVLLCAAIILLFLELFVPSGGLIGVLSGVAAIASIVAFFRYNPTWGMVATGMYLVLGPIGIIYGFKWWINSPLGRRMILDSGDALDPLDPDSPSPSSPEHARAQRTLQLRQLVGARGVAVTLLRPVGAVKIEGQRLDAMAEGGLIESGTPIVVTDVYDNQVKVRAAE